MGKPKAGRLQRELTDRGLIAYRCGQRMFRAGMDWAPELVGAGSTLDPWLTVEERQARTTMLPSSWVKSWRDGWNDTAAAELATGFGDR